MPVKMKYVVIQWVDGKIWRMEILPPDIEEVVKLRDHWERLNPERRVTWEIGFERRR